MSLHGHPGQKWEKVGTKSPAYSDKESLRSIEQWTERPTFGDCVVFWSMIVAAFTLLGAIGHRLIHLIFALVLVLTFSGCATTKRTTYHADGSKEVIEETKPAVKDDTKAFVFGLISAFSPRPVVVQPQTPEAPKNVQKPKPKKKAKDIQRDK